MQQENTLMLLIQQVPSRHTPYYNTRYVKYSKKPTPTPKILNINSPKRHSQYQQVSSDHRPKPQQLPLYRITYI